MQNKHQYLDPSRWPRTAPGFSAGVRIKGEDKMIHHQGMANLESAQPIDDETTFHVASVSKQFTVYMIMLLAQEGKLDLDKDFREYDPEFPDFGHKITPRHFVHHVSGLRDQWDLFRMGGWRYADLKSMDQSYKLIHRQRKLNFEPGTAYNYCNASYTLLAYLIEKISGTRMDVFAKERIFDVIGMKQSFFRVDSRAVIPNRSYSYEQNHTGQFEKAILNYSVYGATSLFSTVADLLLWGEHIIDLAESNPELYSLMTTSFVLKNGNDINYAGGLQCKEFLGYKTIQHGGWDAGFRASLIMVPELQAVTCCLSNHANFKPEGYAKYYLKQALPELAEKKDDFYQEMAALGDGLEAIPEEELCGLYSPDIGLAFWIRREADELYLTMPSMPKLPIEKHANGAYWIKDTEMFFYPRRDADDKLKLYSVYPYDIQVSVKLEVESCPTATEYRGTYYCPELDCNYEIEARDGALVQSQFRLNDAVLRKLKDEADCFIAEPDFDSVQGHFRFERENGQVCGFHLSRPRVRDVHFVKITA